MYDIEKQSLEAHVSLCQERYVGLQHRIDVLETKLTFDDGNVIITIT